MEKTANAINWFEIPADDTNRAKQFYETIFEVTLQDVGEMMGMKMTGFPADPMNGKVSGAIVESDSHEPSHHGVVIYLNASPSIQLVIDRIEGAGGQVVMQRTLISPEIGYMAFFIDSEGNKIGLHSSN